MESHLPIDEVAKRTGLSAHTLRYYERVGLIAGVARAPGGQRRYAASDMEWLGFLLRLRETGMPIGQMLEFARLRGEGNGSVPARRQMLQTHLVDVHAALQAMQASASVLEAKIGLYESMERSLLPLSPVESQAHEPAPRHDTTTKISSTPKRTLPKGPRQPSGD